MGYKLRPLTYYQFARRNTLSLVGFSTVQSRYYTMDQSSALVSWSSPVRKLYPTHLIMTDKIVGHQSESQIPYPSNQIRIVIFYIFHTTKALLATYVISLAGKHYPYTLILERCSIVV